MGTGYTRNDTANNIADGNVINASDLDGEFDAIQAAFNATTGHSHDGTTGEGPQIGTGGIADNAVTLGTKTTGNYVATGAVSGVGLSGSASAEGATFTVTSNATDANTASTIVARDASGNFSAGQITGTSFVTSGDMTFGDNDKALFGASNDLQIYHDSNDSYIKDAGSGGLIVQASTNVAIQGTNTTNLATFVESGAVTLYNNNSAKLATTSSGIDVTGTVTADGLTVDGTATLSSNTGNILTLNRPDGAGSPNIVFQSNGVQTARLLTDASNNIIFERGTTDALKVDGATGDISFYDSTGVTQGLFWDASTQRLGLGTTSPSSVIDAFGSTTNNPLVRINPSSNDVPDLSTYSGTISADVGLRIENKDASAIYSGISLNTRALSQSSWNIYNKWTGTAVGDLLFVGRNGGASMVERMRIVGSSGNVGIGTTSPSSVLQVENATNATIDAVTTGGATARVSSASTAGYLGTTTNHPAVFVTNNTERARIDSDGNVGIGNVSPSSYYSNSNQLVVGSGAARQGITIASSTTTIGQLAFADGTSGDARYEGWVIYDHNTDHMSFGTSASERARIDSSGNVGIGTTSPSQNLSVGGSASGAVALQVTNSTAGTAFNDGMQMFINDTAGGLNMREAYPLQFYVNGSERMRIDSSGNLLVGKTSLEYENTAGHIFRADGLQSSIRSGGNVADFNRLSSDGEVIRVSKDGTTVGSIGVDSSDNLYITGETGNTAGIYMNATAVYPAYQGSGRDNYYDLGEAGARWKDLYLSSQTITSNTGTAAAPNFAISSGALGNNGMFCPSANTIAFSTAGTERARINSLGDLLVGTATTNPHGGTDTGVHIDPTGYVSAGRSGSIALYVNRTTSTGDIVDFRYNGTREGTISITASGVTYNTTSDLRLKENIEPLEATDKLMAMNPVSYNWKADPDGPRSMGFIAQEMQEVMPEAVAVGDDEDAMMSMDYGRITPVLVAALQDAHRKIEQLEQRIADMEAK